MPGLTLHTECSWSSNNYMLLWPALPRFEETESQRLTTYQPQVVLLKPQFYLLGKPDLFTAGHWPVKPSAILPVWVSPNQPVIRMQFCGPKDESWAPRSFSRWNLQPYPSWAPAPWGLARTDLRSLKRTLEGCWDPVPSLFFHFGCSVFQWELLRIQGLGLHSMTGESDSANLSFPFCEVEK